MPAEAMAPRGTGHRSGETNGVTSLLQPGGRCDVVGSSDVSGYCYFPLGLRQFNCAHAFLTRSATRPSYLPSRDPFQEAGAIILHPGFIPQYDTSLRRLAKPRSARKQPPCCKGLVPLPDRRFVHCDGAVDADPDKIDELEDKPARFGAAFVTTAIAFFLVEMGDIKTQLATVAYDSSMNIWAVTAGTTLQARYASDAGSVPCGEKCLLQAGAAQGLVRHARRSSLSQRVSDAG